MILLFKKIYLQECVIIVVKVLGILSSEFVYIIYN